MRNTTPPVVVGAGVVGIFNGAEVIQYCLILKANPRVITAVANQNNNAKKVLIDNQSLRRHLRVRDEMIHPVLLVFSAELYVVKRVSYN
jgi:xanthosine utilization system XapX-like protein